jgi:hypothetical protein
VVSVQAGAEQAGLVGKVAAGFGKGAGQVGQSRAPVGWPTAGLPLCCRAKAWASTGRWRARAWARMASCGWAVVKTMSSTCWLQRRPGRAGRSGGPAWRAARARGRLRRRLRSSTSMTMRRRSSPRPAPSVQASRPRALAGQPARARCWPAGEPGEQRDQQACQGGGVAPGPGCAGQRQGGCGGGRALGGGCQISAPRG